MTTQVQPHSAVPAGMTPPLARYRPQPLCFEHRYWCLCLALVAIVTGFGKAPSVPQGI